MKKPGPSGLVPRSVKPADDIDKLSDLSDTMKAFSRRIARLYDLGPHHRVLLRLACEAHTRMEEAREQLTREGLTVTDRLHRYQGRA